MKPGRELDESVAKAVGWVSLCWHRGELLGNHPGYTWNPDELAEVPLYSTDIGAAMEAFEWLWENNPWDDGGKLLLLGKYDSPSVIILEDTDFSIPNYQDWKNDDPPRGYSKTPNFYIPGESYPHAISLAVVEASKVEK